MNNLFDRTKGNFAFWRIGNVVTAAGRDGIYIYKLRSAGVTTIM